MEKEFYIENLLSKVATKKILLKKGDCPTTYSKEFNIPARTATTVNQGLSCFVPESQATVLKNKISVSANGDYCAFWHDSEFTILQDSYALEGNGYELTEKTALYIIGAMNKALSPKYNWNNKSGWEKIKKEVISLPIKTDSNNNPIIDDTHKYHDEGYIPDWEYMQERIEELEKERIEELEKYLIATGLNDYELTDEDKETLAVFGNYEKSDREEVAKVCKEFKVMKDKGQGLFDCSRGTRLTKSDRIEGNIPLLTAGVGIGNGVAQNIAENDKMTMYQNDITIDMFGMCFYHDYKHYGDDNIHFLVADEISSLSKLYITEMLNKLLENQFSYGRQFRMNTLDTLHISLPIQTNPDGSPVIDSEHKYHKDGYIPDWEFMEKYIRALEKVVIADVVKYKDEMIRATKRVVEGS